jgi:MFS family permease
MTGLSQLIPLLTAAGILLAGNGIQGTLITLRANAEGFDPTFIGLIGTAYFAGFALSCFATPHMIRRVGHIRVFAALAAIASAATLALVLIVDPFAWILIRFATGMCFSGLFTVMESWLAASSKNTDRARVLSVYRLVDLGANAGAQFLLPAFGVLGFELFAIIAIFFAISLVPISLADRSSPKPPKVFKFDLRTVWNISPLACAGCVTLGMTNSAFRLIGPLYADAMGLDTGGVALFMVAGILGGAALQFPLGYLSDLLDRRWMIIMATLGAMLAGLLLSNVEPGNQTLIYAGSFLFGAFALPLYSLSVAHANDQAEPGQYLLVAAGLIFFFAMGATVGPFIASVVLDTFGAPAFFAYTSSVHGILILVTFARMIIRPEVTDEGRSSFAFLLNTSPVFVRMATRKNGKMDEKPPKTPR